MATNHKLVGQGYACTSLVFAHAGFTLSITIRLELASAGSSCYTELCQSFNTATTIHGVVMVFLFLMPATAGAIANFTVPLACRGVDFAFPRFNNAAMQLIPLCGVLATEGCTIEEGCGVG